MKTTKMWLVAIMFLAFAAVSCDNDDDEDPVVESQVLVEYLEGADGGYVRNGMPAIKTAEYVKSGNTAKTVYLIDIRKAEDFAAGHVENAINMTAGEVLPHLEDNSDDDGLEVIIICYSGQSAAWLTNILRVAGYDNAFSMKFGMSSWHADFAEGFWPDKLSNQYASVFEDGNVEKGPEGDLPVLSTGETDGEAILMARIDDVLAEGFGQAAISASTVIGAPESYYIVNYWGEADYTKYGHIPGAMQYTPGASSDLVSEAFLKTLPTDKTVVVYCWTGQTSANMACYLRLLGYDAKSLTYGSNCMIYDELEKGKFTDAAIMGYEYVKPAPAK